MDTKKNAIFKNAWLPLLPLFHFFQLLLLEIKPRTLVTQSWKEWWWRLLVAWWLYLWTMEGWMKWWTNVWWIEFKSWCSKFKQDVLETYVLNFINKVSSLKLKAMLLSILFALSQFESFFLTHQKPCLLYLKWGDSFLFMPFHSQTRTQHVDQL